MMQIDMQPYRTYIADLQNYKKNFEDLAEEARQASDWDHAVVCLLQAIKLRSAILQLEQSVMDYVLSEGGTDLPPVDKVWS